jgi:hypothetical protein
MLDFLKFSIKFLKMLSDEDVQKIKKIWIDEHKIIIFANKNIKIVLEFLCGQTFDSAKKYL